MNAHILVFDSGLGGTTVLDEIKKLLPHCRYSYALDNAAFPYGDKTDAFLQQRICRFMQRLINEAQPDLVVIACNTASTLCLAQLREQFSVPFVGVVPAIKTAATFSKSHVIGLLATDATHQSDYIDNLKDAHAMHCQVNKIPVQDLVAIAEQKMLFQHDVEEQVLRILSPLMTLHDIDHMDTLVLGCTHFPALKNEIAKAWPRTITLIDSGAAIAKRVEHLLSKMSSLKHSADATLFVTDDTHQQQLLSLMHKYEILQDKEIDL